MGPLILVIAFGVVSVALVVSLVAKLAGASIRASFVWGIAALFALVLPKVTDVWSLLGFGVIFGLSLEFAVAFLLCNFLARWYRR